MPMAFTEEADFSGITTDGPLQLTTVMHAARVEVDETGTTASAYMFYGVAGSLGVTFLADRPFLFLIRDDHTGSILFIGRLIDPSQPQTSL